MRRGRKFVSPYNPASSSKQSKRAQSAEDLYGDILTIKRKNVRLKQENKELKTSIQRLTHQVKKKGQIDLPRSIPHTGTARDHSPASPGNKKRYGLHRELE